MPETHALAVAARTWNPDPGLLLGLTAAVLLYAAGVARAWSRAGLGGGISWGSVVAGALGFAAVTVALLSPLDALSGLLFSAHMTQHLILMLIAGPLLVVAAPLLALLWVLPSATRKRIVNGWRRSGPMRSTFHLLTHPLAAWLVFVALLWLWHLPAVYQWALASEAAHALEHLTLLAAAGLLWWTLLQPLGRRRLNRFAAPLVLFVTALQGGVLGAMITLSPAPWYRHYERVAEALGTSAMADQQLAGLLMWVPPGAIYLGLACWLLYRAMARMEDSNSLRSYSSRLLLAGPALLLTRAEAQVLEPAGPAAASISSLWWLLLVVAAAVCLVVYVLLLVAVFRRRSAADREPPLGYGPFVLLAGVVVPLLILAPLLLYSLGVTSALTRPADDPLTVEVIGHQWWWEVRYPEAGVVDANEIHVPAGRQVRLRLSSADVIHSFWAPSLQGKMDLVPGNVNTLLIEAFEPGIHRAQCAEFCGVQHANMRLLVVSEPAESFAEWLAERQRPAGVPRSSLARAGREVFLEGPCVGCHTVEGTQAQGQIGPNLTHVASRLTLGAGTVANNRGNLGGWIVNSQAIKPGNKMPPIFLESQDLQALLAYLGTLE